MDLADQGPSLGPLRPTTGPTTGPTGGHLGVVKILCELRADTDKGATRYGASPLFTAAEYGHAEAPPKGAGMGDGGWDGMGVDMAPVFWLNDVKWIGLTLAF